MANVSVGVETRTEDAARVSLGRETRAGYLSGLATRLFERPVLTTATCPKKDLLRDLTLVMAGTSRVADAGAVALLKGQRLYV